MHYRVWLFIPVRVITRYSIRFDWLRLRCVRVARRKIGKLTLSWAAPNPHKFADGGRRRKRDGDVESHDADADESSSAATDERRSSDVDDSVAIDDDDVAERAYLAKRQMDMTIVARGSMVKECFAIRVGMNLIMNSNAFCFVSQAKYTTANLPPTSW